MHHLIERSIQKYRLMNGPLRCLAPCDPCGIRSENREQAGDKPPRKQRAAMNR